VENILNISLFCGILIGMNTSKTTTQNRQNSLIIKFLDIFFVTLFFFVVVFLFIGSTGLTYQGHTFDRHIVLLSFSLLGFLVFLGKGVLFGKIVVPKTPLDTPLIIFLGVLVLSSVLSGNIWHNLWGFWEDPSRGVFAWISYIFLYYWTFLIILMKKIYWVYGALIVGGIGLIGSVIFRGGVFFDEQSALLLALLLFPFFLGIFQTVLLSEKRRVLRIFASILVLLVIVGGVFVFGKFSYHLSWWWLFLPLAGWFFLVFPTLIFQKNRWSWMPMILFFFVGTFYFIGTLFSQQASEKNSITTNIPDTFAWDIAKKSLSEHTFFGIGPASYGEAFSLYRHINLNQTNIILDRFYEANGLFYEFPVTVGIAGSLTFLLLFLFFFGFSFFRGFLGKKENVYLWLSALISVCVFFAVILFLSVTSSVFSIGFLLIALLLALGGDMKDLGERVFSLRPSSEYILSVAFVVAVLFGMASYGLHSLYSFFVADMWAKKATSEFIEAEQKVQFLEKSIERNPFSSRYTLLMAQVHLEKLMNMYDNDTPYENPEQLAEFEQLINRISEYLSQSKDLANNDVAVLELVAQTYTNLSFYVSSFLSVAENVYSEAILLEPQNPRLYVKRGELLVRRVAKIEDPSGKRELILQAKDDFETALSKKEEFSQAWYLLAITQEGLQEVEGAINSASRAVFYSPNDTGALNLLARLYTLKEDGESRQRAYRLYERSIEVNPEDMGAYYALARMYGDDGNTVKAIEYYDDVLKRMSVEEDEELYEKVLEEKAAFTSPTQPEPRPTLDEEDRNALGEEKEDDGVDMEGENNSIDNEGETEENLKEEEDKDE
jgi:tetratricopeptide (TPR) repeat protein